MSSSLAPERLTVSSALSRELDGMSRDKNTQVTGLLMTVEEAKRVLRIGLRQTYELVKDGTIPSLKLGRTIRIPRRPFMTWVQTGHWPLDPLSDGCEIDVAERARPAK
jgi:excisionase family DNA binding protein